MNEDSSSNKSIEDFIHQIPEPETNELPTSYADRVAVWYSGLNNEDVKGQIFTPVQIATFMAENVQVEEKVVRVLDPGSGIGILGCAVIERLSEVEEVRTILLDAVDTDSNVQLIAEKVLEYAKEWLKSKKKQLVLNLVSADFITIGLERIGLGLEEQTPSLLGDYHIVIMNPPYFKLPSSDERIKAVERLACKQTNIYSLFLTVASLLLRQDGILISINPRSFASGRYFQAFRNFF
ncbi:MAG: Eco57I restriction-modification methylase domain-containing protein, partial [Candidatus Thorarchaeota archaeon]